MNGDVAGTSRAASAARNAVPESPDRRDVAIEVVAPSRLHFGLLAWGGDGRQFGGVGMMVERPCVRLRVARAERFYVEGPHAERVEEFVRRWFKSPGDGEAPRVACRVLEAPPQHVGLGLGTQLGLSVGLALNRLCEGEAPAPVELALRTGRGLRSSVGTYGFFQGGFVHDPGKFRHEPVATTAQRHAVPESWRVVLVRPAGSSGEAGEQERRAFATLPPVPPARTARLNEIIQQRLVPALARHDCGEFGRALYEYGCLAGECFAAWQGGPFNGPVLTKLVERLRTWGVEGVGQSSWGPTLFAVVESEEAARSVESSLRAGPDGESLEVLVTRPAVAGARVEEIPAVRFAHG